MPLLEAHRAEVTVRIAEAQENLKLIDHKIDVYRGRLAVGDADQLWPRPLADQGDPGVSGQDRARCR